MEIKVSQIKVIDTDNRSNAVTENDGIIKSVETEGVLVPLLCYQEGDSYILVAGHRRYASAVYFNIETVPVELISKEKAEIARALENIDRKNLGPFDECAEITKLFNKGYSIPQIAQILDVSVCRVNKRMKLNNICDKVKEEFLQGNMDIIGLEEFATIPMDLQESVLDDCRSYDPEDIREAYFDAAGYHLEDIGENILKTKTEACNYDCRNCPFNPISEESLFADLENEKGVCKDLEKLADKVIAAFKSHPECKGLCFTGYGEDHLIKAIEDKGEHVYTSYNKQDETGYLCLLDERSKKDAKEKAVLYFGILGNIYYDMATLPKEKEEDAEEEKDPENEFRHEMEKKKDKLLKDLGKAKRDFIFKYIQAMDLGESFERDSVPYVLAKEVVTTYGRRGAVCNYIKGDKSSDELVESLTASDLVKLAYLDIKMVENSLTFADKSNYLSFSWTDDCNLKYERGNILSVPDVLGLKDNPEVKEAAKALEKAYSDIDKLMEKWNKEIVQFKTPENVALKKKINDYLAK